MKLKARLKARKPAAGTFEWPGQGTLRLPGSATLDPAGSSLALRLAVPVTVPPEADGLTGSDGRCTELIFGRVAADDLAALLAITDEAARTVTMVARSIRQSYAVTDALLAGMDPVDKGNAFTCAVFFLAKSRSLRRLRRSIGMAQL